MMVERKLEMPEFVAGLEGELLMDEPMSKHTSWRAGGNADISTRQAIGKIYYSFFPGCPAQCQ